MSEASNDERSDVGSQETGSQGDTTRGDADDSMISGQDDDDRSRDESQDDDDDDEDADRRASTGSRGGGGANSSSRQSRSYRHLRIRATSNLPLTDDPTISSTVREIGKTACWSLSTAKPGNGVDQLRDESNETYWQSDGLQPHYVNIQFARRQTVCAIAMYIDFNLDESYTPKRMKIRVGETFHNLEEIRVVELREPRGWCTIPLWRKFGEDVLDTILLDASADDDEDDDDNTDGNSNRKRKKVPLWKRKPLRTHFVQISITSMHQNGRDTHIRQVKIFGPREDANVGTMVGRYGRGFSSSNASKNDGEGKNGGASVMMSGKLAHTTVGMSQFSTIR